MEAVSVSLSESVLIFITELELETGEHVLLLGLAAVDLAHFDIISSW